MIGIDTVHCNVCLRAATSAWHELMVTPVGDALNLYPNWGKGDTLGLDCVPEMMIKRKLAEFDPNAILVTEEDPEIKKRWPTSSDPNLQPLMFFCDPTDRSKYIKGFLEKIAEGRLSQKIGEIMDDHDIGALWDKAFDKPEDPAAVTGATSAITCVDKGKVIFAVILNYITQTIFVACSIKIVALKLPTFNDPLIVNGGIDLAHMLQHGTEVTFPSSHITCPKPDDYNRFVAFVGKTGYKSNLDDSHIFSAEDPEQPLKLLHHSEPGGPARILYLSDQQSGHGAIGFILANGEKIGEWIHWLAFAKYAKNSQGDKALRVFEIHIDRPWTKEGILMSTSKPYSIFVDGDQSSHLDLSRLKNFDIPSRFRSMLVVTPDDNDQVIINMQKHRFRDVTHVF
jgi:hypothetical protein